MRGKVEIVRGEAMNRGEFADCGADLLPRAGARAHELWADNAEDELRAKPMDAATVRRLEALYTLADETWERIQALRARLSGGPSVIYFNRRLAEPAAKAWRQALV